MLSGVEVSDEEDEGGANDDIVYTNGTTNEVTSKQHEQIEKQHEAVMEKLSERFHLSSPVGLLLSL